MKSEADTDYLTQGDESSSFRSDGLRILARIIARSLSPRPALIPVNKLQSELGADDRHCKGRPSTDSASQ
jgi:hypothetical protein